MNNLLMSEPHPDVFAYAPKLCFCGKRTVKSHEYWFCSTECARLDALRSLDNPECHYRNNVRKAYVQAGVPELYPRRMISVDQLRPGPTARHVVVNSPVHLPPPTNATHRRNPTILHRDARDRNMVGFQALSQVTGNVLNERTPRGEAPVAGRYDHAGWEIPPRAPSRAQHRGQRVEEEPFMEAFDPTRIHRGVPQSTNNLRSNIGKSVAALFSKSRKDNPSGNPERVFGHTVNTIVPPMRKESLPSNRQPRNPPSAASASKSKMLRRSRSFAVGSPLDKRDTVMHIVEEMRREMAGSFDPRSLFDHDDD